MKDYIAISREIKRRGEAKVNARKRHIHHALAACLLLFICVPVGFGVWQLTAPVEAPSEIPSAEITDQLHAEGLLPPGTTPGFDLSEEPEEEPTYSAEQDLPEEPGDPSEESEPEEDPIFSEEPGEPEEPGDPEVPEGPGVPSDEAIFPEGITVEMLLTGELAMYAPSFELPEGAVGVIGVLETQNSNAFWNPKKGYILLKEGEQISGSGDSASDSILYLQQLCEDAGIDYPETSLTREEGEAFLKALREAYIKKNDIKKDRKEFWR